MKKLYLLIALCPAIAHAVPTITPLRQKNLQTYKDKQAAVASAQQGFDAAQTDPDSTPLMRAAARAKLVAAQGAVNKAYQSVS